MTGPHGDEAGGTHWPAIQGLRGAAVAAVLVYHHDDGWLPGGFLGVSLFFTLSGFLITGLLLRERAERGLTSLGRFWARRARRLLPIALLGLLVAAASVPFVATDAELARFGGDIVAAAFDVANWRFAFGSLEYGDTFAVASPVTHYWSLSIEEQFYAVFPIIVLVARTRRRLGAALAVVAIGSLMAQVLIDNPNRVYLGTDTRAFELAAGGLLAVWWAGGKRAPRGLVDAVALPVAVAVVATWALVDLGSSWIYDGGLALVAATSVVLVLASVGGRLTPAVLGWRPLTVVGDHSYALYVMHFPVYLVLSAERVGVDGVPLLGVRLAVTAAVAYVAHRLVERPVHVGGALRGWHAQGALVAGMATVVAAAALLPSAPIIGDRAGLGGLVASGTRQPTVVTVPVTTASPPSGEPRTPRLLVAGDSTALVNGYAMQGWGTSTGRVVVDVVGAGGCAFLQEGEVVYREGWVTGPDGGCRVLLDTVGELVRANEPDAVVVFIGSAQLADWILPGTTERTGIGDAAFDERFVAAADAALARLSSFGVPVLLATLPVPAWVPEATFPDAALQGSGPVTLNSATRTQRFNSLLADIVEGHPLVRLVPYAEGIAGPDGAVDPSIRPDGLHLEVGAVEAAMDGWLEDELRRAYLDVVADERLTTAPTTWSPGPAPP